MNIFVLDKSPQKAAEQHCDKHVIKMILESCQILSTVHRFLDGKEYTELSASKRRLKRWRLADDREELLYKATHVNHPCTVWARENSANYAWLVELTKCLSAEYTYRYGKVHKCKQIGLIDKLQSLPTSIKVVSYSEPKTWAQALPEEYKNLKDPVGAYRNMYVFEKEDLLYWKVRKPPEWVGKALIKRNEKHQ